MNTIDFSFHTGLQALNTLALSHLHTQPPGSTTTIKVELHYQHIHTGKVCIYDMLLQFQLNRHGQPEGGVVELNGVWQHHKRWSTPYAEMMEVLGCIVRTQQLQRHDQYRLYAYLQKDDGSISTEPYLQLNGGDKPLQPRPQPKTSTELPSAA